MKMRQALVITAAVIVLVLAGCSSTNTFNIKLDGSSWFLATLADEPAMSDTLVTLVFRNGNLSGIDGCNSYGTSYTLDREKITINGNIAVTLMACPEPIMQQATAYYTALGQVETYNIEGKRLTFYDAANKVLATFSLQETVLGGTAWVVAGYNNGQDAVVSVLNGSELSVQFSTAGKLFGSAGCNSYTSTYDTQGSRISVGSTATTKKNCNDPSGVMVQEMQFIAALESAVSYRFNGGNLELHTADGALAVTLHKAS